MKRTMRFADWQKLTSVEQIEIASQWSPQDTEAIDSLLQEIVKAFREKYPHYEIPGLGNVFGSLMLVVSRPFIFDKRSAPGSFMGLAIRYTLSEPVPEGFKIYESYVWAPETYARFVEANRAHIRRAFGDPSMQADEMLHALIGIPFHDWIVQCRKFGPGHTDL